MSNSGPRPITFEEAIARTQDSVRHLLLGNGFSISARESFKYQSLYERAQPFSAPVDALFKRLKTTDFEEVLKEIHKLMVEEPNGQYGSLEQEVRGAFLGALSSVHPDKSISLSTEEIDRCVTFLKPFVGVERKRQRGRVYTTNYDLLLYWVIVRSKQGGRNRLNCDDCHEGDRGFWQKERTDPSLIYLHGGLHLYDSNRGQFKLLYQKGASLISQTRELLNAGHFPVFVAEGTSEEKASRIQKSEYLKAMSYRLKAGFKDPDAVLFTYGHSLSDRDAHLLKTVGEGKIKAVYIGKYKGMSAGQCEIDRWTAIWEEARISQRLAPPEVWVYDTSEFSPWR